MIRSSEPGAMTSPISPACSVTGRRDAGWPGANKWRLTMSKLTGKVALVTGSNKGIGKGIAQALGAEGARITITARGTEALNRTAEELRTQGAEVLAIPADVSEERQVQQVFAGTLERFGRLDILVNNAGA